MNLQFFIVKYNDVPKFTAFRYKGEFWYKNVKGTANLCGTNKVENPVDKFVGLCYPEYQRMTSQS